jgi:hypothetical protein
MMQAALRMQVVDMTVPVRWPRRDCPGARPDVYRGLARKKSARIVIGAVAIFDHPSGRTDEHAARDSDCHRRQGYQQRADHDRLLQLADFELPGCVQAVRYLTGAVGRDCTLAESNRGRSELIHAAGGHFLDVWSSVQDRGASSVSYATVAIRTIASSEPLRRPVLSA